MLAAPALPVLHPDDLAALVAVRDRRRRRRGVRRGPRRGLRRALAAVAGAAGRGADRRRAQRRRRRRAAATPIEAVGYACVGVAFALGFDAPALAHRAAAVRRRGRPARVRRRRRTASFGLTRPRAGPTRWGSSCPRGAAAGWPPGGSASPRSCSSRPTRSTRGAPGCASGRPRSGWPSRCSSRPRRRSSLTRACRRSRSSAWATCCPTPTGCARWRTANEHVARRTLPM